MIQPRRDRCQRRIRRQCTYRRQRRNGRVSWDRPTPRGGWRPGDRWFHTCGSHGKFRNHATFCLVHLCVLACADLRLIMGWGEIFNIHHCLAKGFPLFPLDLGHNGVAAFLPWPQGHWWPVQAGSHIATANILGNLWWRQGLRRVLIPGCPGHSNHSTVVQGPGKIPGGRGLSPIGGDWIPLVFGPGNSRFCVPGGFQLEGPFPPRNLPLGLARGPF